MDGKVSNQLTEYDIAKTESKYGGFIEVSLLRFEYFVFEKETDYGNDQVFKADGYMTGLTYKYKKRQPGRLALYLYIYIRCKKIIDHSIRGLRIHRIRGLCFLVI